jgi:hypothetical protein
MAKMIEFVWLTELRTPGILVSMGAFYSIIKYTREGIDYEVEISNDEWEFYEWSSVHDHYED